MSSFSIKGISQLNLSLNIDNKKNIENIQIIINELKELIDILSFRITDVSVSTQQQINKNQEEVEEQFDSFVYDSGTGSGDGTTGDGTTGDGTTGDGTTGGDDSQTTALVGYF